MAGTLISAADLAQHIDDPHVVVIDCRWYLGEPLEGRRAYDAGHLPRAHYASLDVDLSGPDGPGRHPLPSPDAFASTMSAYGVRPESLVVAYDDRGGAIAARLWWMLTEQGHRGARVLDGGLQAWVAHGGDLSTVAPDAAAGSFIAAPWSSTMDTGAVATRDRGTLVVDARSAERYAGTEEPIDPKAGHIPGAVSMPMTDNLAEDMTMLQPDRLRRLFEAAGTADADVVVAQCGSGVTACHTILAAEIAGLSRPLLYVGSWSDWSSTDLPIATGSTP